MHLYASCEKFIMKLFLKVKEKTIFSSNPSHIPWILSAERARKKKSNYKSFLLIVNPIARICLCFHNIIFPYIFIKKRICIKVYLLLLILNLCITNTFTLTSFFFFFFYVLCCRYHIIYHINIHIIYIFYNWYANFLLSLFLSYFYGFLFLSFIYILLYMENSD